MGGAALARLGDQGAHAHPSRRLPRGIREERHRQRHGRALGARRRGAQPDRLRDPRISTGRRRWSRASRCSPTSARCGRSSRTAASRSSRPTSASASSSSTTSRRATSSCRRSTSCAPTSPRSSAAPSAPTRSNSDIPYLAESQRAHTRPYYLKAQAGMTGANFAIAETGSFVVCTNEGNADLGANLPQAAHRLDRHREADCRGSSTSASSCGCCRAARSARRSPRSPRTSGRRGRGTEMHVVLVDNGRSERLGMEDFWYSLKCIRCGACMNTCPVYRGAAASATARPTRGRSA